MPHTHARHLDAAAGRRQARRNATFTALDAAHPQHVVMATTGVRGLNGVPSAGGGSSVDGISVLLPCPQPAAMNHEKKDSFQNRTVKNPIVVTQGHVYFDMET